MNREYEHIVHTFEPVYSNNSKILILGSFPSVKSRENNFYYGHPQNRFWKVITHLVNEMSRKSGNSNADGKATHNEPITIEEKEKILLENGIAIWDVIYSCDIKGSSDSSIKNVVPADIGYIIEETHLDKIYANGKMAAKLYKRYQEKTTNIPIIELPSTSPANAAYSIEKLQKIWCEVILQ